MAPHLTKVGRRIGSFILLPPPTYPSSSHKEIQIQDTTTKSTTDNYIHRSLKPLCCTRKQSETTFIVCLGIQLVEQPPSNINKHKSHQVSVSIHATIFKPASFSLLYHSHSSSTVFIPLSRTPHRTEECYLLAPTTNNQQLKWFDVYWLLLRLSGKYMRPYDLSTGDNLQ